MMEVTDRHFRRMLRFLSRDAHLYTEMVHSRAVLADARRYLAHMSAEYPLVLQLGGDDPVELEEASRIAVDMGYSEINLNCGCPSERVQRGGFGACLMAEPVLVSQIVSAMKKSGASITVKHRIGIQNIRTDEEPDYDALRLFVGALADAGCERFIVHARTAILTGLSPAENRSVPPLRFDLARRLKNDFPHLPFEINGGIADLETAGALLEEFDGVMIGRAVRDNPMLFSGVDRVLAAVRQSPENRAELTPHDLLHAMIPYVERSPDSAHIVARNLLNIFHGYPGARRYRRFLSEELPDTDHKSVADLLVEATRYIEKKAERSEEPVPSSV